MKSQRSDLRSWSSACAFSFFLLKSVLCPPGGFLFEGLSDEEDDFHPVSGLAACPVGNTVPGMLPSQGPGAPKLGGGHRLCHTVAFCTWQPGSLPKNCTWGGGGVIWVHHRASSLILGPPFSRAPGPRPLAAPPAPAQHPWGIVELPDPGPSPRASWPLPWPWPALRRAALTRLLLAPRYGDRAGRGRPGPQGRCSPDEVGLPLLTLVLDLV